MAKTLKAKLPVDQSIPTDFRQFIPAREICDQLVQLYLRTFETVFRVLHIPTFEQEYAHYWDDPGASSEFFVIQLLLMMAIGMCFLQDRENPEGALHESASHWIYAIQLWLSAPFEKNRLDVGGVRIQCLLLLALQTNAVGGDLTWISAGSLVRTAMTVGLHRDPIHLPNISILEAEVRRRLWATVMEIMVQTSLDSGMQPFISCDDFDCDPPSNLDDIQLDKTTEFLPASKPIDTFTQTSTQCALMRSLSCRLSVAKALNDLRTHLSYEDTIRIGAELTEICRQNSILYQSFFTRDYSENQPRPTAFQVKLLDLLTRRFLLSIHSPFAFKANENVMYYFSRKICLESSIHLLSYSPSPLLLRMQGRDRGDETEEDDYMRLRIFSRGLFKCIFLHASSTIFSELMIELRNSSAPATSPPSHNDLYQAVRDVVDLTWRRVKMGEKSVKAHIYFACALSQVDAMRNGTSLEPQIYATTKKSLESCYEVLIARARNIMTPRTTI